MKKLWTDLHSNIHHNHMDELDKWVEHAKAVLDFWPIAYYPFQMIKTESGAGLEDLCPAEEIEKDWELVREKVKEVNAEGIRCLWDTNGRAADLTATITYFSWTTISP